MVEDYGVEQGSGLEGEFKVEDLKPLIQQIKDLLAKLEAKLEAILG